MLTKTKTKWEENIRFFLSLIRLKIGISRSVFIRNAIQIFVMAWFFYNLSHQLSSLTIKNIRFEQTSMFGNVSLAFRRISHMSSPNFFCAIGIVWAHFRINLRWCHIASCFFTGSHANIFFGFFWDLWLTNWRNMFSCL